MGIHTSSYDYCNETLRNLIIMELFFVVHVYFANLEKIMEN